MPFTIKENISWVGKVDWELRAFHGQEYSTHSASICQKDSQRFGRESVLTKFPAPKTLVNPGLSTDSRYWKIERAEMDAFSGSKLAAWKLRKVRVSFARIETLPSGEPVKRDPHPGRSSCELMLL